MSVNCTPISFLKRNFRKGGANLRVCLESRQEFATFSEISFEKQSSRDVTK